MEIKYDLPLSGDISFLDKEIQNATVLTIGSKCKHIYTRNLYMKAKKVAYIEVATGNPYFEEREGVLYSKGKKELIWYPPGKRDKTYYIPAEVNTLKADSIQNTILNKLTGGGGLRKIERGFCSINTLYSLNEFSIQSDSFSSIEGILYDKEFTELVACPISSKCDLDRASLRVIRANAMAFNANITDVVLHDNLQSIENGAFLASMITSITGGFGLKTIGIGAFADCKNLEEAVFQEGLKVIETGAFNHCLKLKEIVIPKSVTSIGYDRSYSTISKKTVILCLRGSYAEQFAKEHGYLTKAL